MKETIQASADFLKTRIKDIPKAVLVLGSGLEDIANTLENSVQISYDKIPHFAQSTVKGHAGSLIYGYYKNIPVLIQNGRLHYYEGYSMQTITFPIYVYHAMGIKTLVLTNACGGVNKSHIQIGDIVVLKDFINFMPSNPLIGINDESLGPRFPDMTEPYSLKLRERTKTIFQNHNLSYKEGIYGSFMGPYYETKAEIDMMRRSGIDLVGMSTVPETIVANYLGLDVVAFGSVTNMATGIQQQKHSHDAVLNMAKKISVNLKKIISDLIQTL